MINIDNLKKNFGKLEVLKGVTFQLKPGLISAILGPNGSGKTTVIKSILGLVIPNEGSIEVEGKSVKNSWSYRKEVSYLPQIARFPENLKSGELIKMVKDIREQEADETELIQLFDLKPYLNKKLRNLSGGTRQKLNIVLAFMFDSPLIILDEPTAGLDPVALIRLKKLIKEEQQRGKTILITTHIMSLVEELAEDIIFLLEGKIYFQGSLQELNEITGESKLDHSIAKILESNGDLETKERIPGPLIHGKA